MEFDWDEYKEESLETQEQLEDELESSTDNLDPKELKIEINELERLIRKTASLKEIAIERKYDELDQTLFGCNGLLNQGKRFSFLRSQQTHLIFRGTCY